MTAKRKVTWEEVPLVEIHDIGVSSKELARREREALRQQLGTRERARRTAKGLTEQMELWIE